MAKHKKKHVRRFHRGAPTKPPKDVDAEVVHGRPRIHPIEYNTHTFVRSTPGQRLLWEAAARFESQALRLPRGMSLNAWILRTLDERASAIAAKARGVTVDSKVAADIEAALDEGK